MINEMSINVKLTFQAGVNDRRQGVSELTFMMDFSPPSRSFRHPQVDLKALGDSGVRHAQPADM